MSAGKLLKSRRLGRASALAAMAIAGAAMAVAAPSTAQPVTTAPMRMEGTLLRVAAEAEARTAPDHAIISMGVQTEGKTAQSALAENAKNMQAVFQALKRAGIAERDVQTSSLSISPQYVYAEREPPRLTGYQASNQVSVVVRDLKRLGQVVDAVVGSGSNQVSGVSFGVSDPDKALDGARRDAVAKARARAELYAQAAGLKVARIVEISEAASAPPPMPLPMAKMAMAEATPTAPGEVALSITVAVAFELR